MGGMESKARRMSTVEGEEDTTCMNINALAWATTVDMAQRILNAYEMHKVILRPT